MRTLAWLPLLLVLTACDGGDPVASAVRDVATANQARAVKEGTVSSQETSDTLTTRQLLEARRRALVATRTSVSTIRDPELRRLAEAAAEQDAQTIARLEAWRPVPE